MKCWECGKEITIAVRVHYLIKPYPGADPIEEKVRDVCEKCEKKLPYNPGHYIEVKSFRQRELRRR